MTNISQELRYGMHLQNQTRYLARNGFVYSLISR